jgi:hypothetical protein
MRAKGIEILACSSLDDIGCKAGFFVPKRGVIPEKPGTEKESSVQSTFIIKTSRATKTKRPDSPCIGKSGLF